MKIEHLIGLTKEQLLEMDKSQKGAPGWNISDDEPGGKEHYVKAVKAKDVVKSAHKELNKAFKGVDRNKVEKHSYKKNEFDMKENHRDAYERDYDSSVSGFGRSARDWDEGDQEPPNNFAIYINGKKWKVFPGEGYHADDHRERIQHQRLRDMCAKKTAQSGKKWSVHATGENPTSESVSESATAGATSAANIGTVDAPQLSPGKARGKKSYTGSMSSGSGTKAPPQPVVKQPKNKDGTAKNGLDIKGTSLFGGPANEGAVIKRR
jgi:hypothetical protein